MRSRGLRTLSAGDGIDDDGDRHARDASGGGRHCRRLVGRRSLQNERQRRAVSHVGQHGGIARDVLDAIAAGDLLADLGEKAAGHARDDRGAHGSVGSLVFSNADEPQRRRGGGGETMESLLSPRASSRSQDDEPSNARKPNRLRVGACGCVVGCSRSRGVKFLRRAQRRELPPAWSAAPD